VILADLRSLLLLFGLVTILVDVLVNVGQTSDDARAQSAPVNVHVGTVVPSTFSNIYKAAFHDTDTDTDSPDTPTSLRPTHAISSRGCRCRGMRTLPTALARDVMQSPQSVRPSVRICPVA